MRENNPRPVSLHLVKKEEVYKEKCEAPEGDAHRHVNVTSCDIYAETWVSEGGVVDLGTPES